MIRKLLIANRGEIACRIIRTCRRMGIATVAVFSDADATALHVQMADEAVHLGGSPASESYLNIERVLDAAARTHADAIHPGYGFLAENATFARAVQNAGLIFVGPPPEAIEAMGRKREAKLMLKNVPLVPGYNGTDQSNTVMIAAAQEIGFPVMVKASSGGGGKGMRRVDNPDDLPAALDAARREATQAFGDPTLILEKLIENPHHIEIQIFGDTHGNVTPLGERECSIQRRHQKIIEETPSPFLNAATREAMSKVAADIGRQLHYVGAGTVEFLVDADRNFYFMEMNTRLQVEHPVTEMVFGEDLVQMQIDVAEGGSILNVHYDFTAEGHAIEARIYAEDPTNGFLPAIGPILHWGGIEASDTTDVRVDAGVRTGDAVTVHYDPMVAKVIVHAESRAKAIRKLDHALKQLKLLGVRNNIRFLRDVINHPDFVAGKTTTHFIADHPELLSGNAEDAPPAVVLPVVVIAAALAQHAHQTGGIGTHWRNNSVAPMKQTFRLHKDETASIEVALKHRKDAGGYIVHVGEHTHHVSLLSYLNDEMVLRCDGHQQRLTLVRAADVWWVHHDGMTHTLVWQTPLPLPGSNAAAAGSLRAPMPGQVVSVLVEAGQQVSEGEVLLTLEAMKMEHRIQAPYDGMVGEVHFTVGETVQADAILLELHRAEDGQ